MTKFTPMLTARQAVAKLRDEIELRTADGTQVVRREDWDEILLAKPQGPTTGWLDWLENRLDGGGVGSAAAAS